jgi:DNA-binding CsgD family transcriptional regulator
MADAVAGTPSTAIAETLQMIVRRMVERIDTVGLLMGFNEAKASRRLCGPRWGGTPVFAHCPSNHVSFDVVMGNDMESLVERGVAIHAIDELIDRMRRGAGATLVFDGAAGIGTSTMLEHGARMAANAGLLVLRARGDELGRHVPHGALQQLLARTVRELDADSLVQLTASPAASLIDALGARRPDSPFAPGQVATGLWWLLDWLCERIEQPILIVVDDLQWIDGSSLEAFAFLAARVDGMCCGMLVADRTGDPCIAPVVRSRLRSAAPTRIVELAALSAAAGALLAREMDPSLDERDVEAIHQTTGGNPFLLTELVAHLRLGDATTVPPRVVNHVHARLQRLQDDARLVGAATAVLGQWATVARIAAVSELPSSRVEQLIDELVDSNVLTRSHVACSFRHPLLRDAMLAAVIGDAERRRLSRQAGQSAIDDGLEPTAIASLLLDAPIAGDTETSARLIAGAVSALDAASPREAIDFLDRAIAEPITDDAMRATAWTLLVQAHTAIDDKAATLAAATAALEHLVEPQERSNLHVTIANVRISLGDVTGAMRGFTDAANEIENVPGSASRVVMLRAGGASFGRFLEPTDGNERDPMLSALSSNPSQDTHETRILLANIATSYVLGNRDSPQARVLARRALAGTTLLDETAPDAPIFHVATAALAWSDDYDSALPALDAAVAEATRRGSALGYAISTGSRGGVLLRRGELVRAAADLHSSIEGRREGWTSYLPMTGFMAARTCYELDDRDAIRSTVDICVPAGKLADWGPLEPYAHACLAYVALADGDDSRALELLLDAVAAARRQFQHSITLAEWRHLAVELAVRNDECHGVLDLSRESLILARALGAPRPLGLALRAAALVAEDPAAGRELLDEAIAVLDAGAVRVELARSLQQRGIRTRFDAGSDDGRDDLERALKIATECGARRIIGEIAALGIVTPAAPILDLLTPGEARVAELAASGLTNRDIAGAQFVTVKAVEWHLSNVYRKLGIRGRRQLAMALAAPPLG